VEISSQSDVIKQKLEQKITLLLLEPNDSSSELRVDVQSFLACDWMCSNEGMDITDRSPANDRATCECSIGLLVTRVYGL
jgi:hypothetical protein